MTEFARTVVLEKVGELSGTSRTIPHGIEKRFYKAPRAQKPLEAFSNAAPFKLLYVSTVDFYKHQWNVARAVATLRKQGMPVEVFFVGGGYRPAMRRLGLELAEFDPAGEFLHYDGATSFSDMHSVYHDADAFVFASTCENMPIILLEAMASGLPIACSDRPPMTDILGDAGVYMDPLDSGDIQRALEIIATSAGLRERCAHLAYERAKSYCWGKCARATFAFIQSIAAGRPD